MVDARLAVAELKRWTEQYSDAITERERVEAELAAATLQDEAARRFYDEIESLRGQFMELWGMTDPHQRGYAFQTFLDKLFVLFDLEPRLSYKLEHGARSGSPTRPEAATTQLSRCLASRTATTASSGPPSVRTANTGLGRGRYRVGWSLPMPGLDQVCLALAGRLGVVQVIAVDEDDPVGRILQRS